jgi:hypothetical protein
VAGTDHASHAGVESASDVKETDAPTKAEFGTTAPPVGMCAGSLAWKGNVCRGMDSVSRQCVIVLSPAPRSSILSWRGPGESSSRLAGRGCKTVTADRIWITSGGTFYRFIEQRHQYCSVERLLHLVGIGVKGLMAWSPIKSIRPDTSHSDGQALRLFFILFSMCTGYCSVKGVPCTVNCWRLHPG